MSLVSLCALDHMHYACGLHFLKTFCPVFKTTFYWLLQILNYMFLKKKSDLRVDLLCFFCFQFEFINNIWHFSNIAFSFNNITFLFYWQFWLFDLLPPASEKTTVEGEERFCGPDLQTYGCLPPIRVLILLTSTLLFVWTKRNTCQE